MMQQCLTCTRRNIPPESVSCPACGSVDLRGYDPEQTENENMSVKEAEHEQRKD